jgi:acetate kinase
MGTRAGDLDPGVAWFLMRAGNLSPDAFNDLVNLQSGLAGISEGSSDMRDLLAREAADSRARDAVTLFCYQARKWLGAYAVVLGGLDTVVFAGGIGENAPPVRARICAGLEFLGIELDAARNDSSAAVISSAGSRVAVRVMHTDEESMIAKSVCRELKLAARRNDDGEIRNR